MKWHSYSRRIDRVPLALSTSTSTSTKKRIFHEGRARVRQKVHFRIKTLNQRPASGPGCQIRVLQTPEGLRPDTISRGVVGLLIKPILVAFACGKMSVFGQKLVGKPLRIAYRWRSQLDERFPPSSNHYSAIRTWLARCVIDALLRWGCVPASHETFALVNDAIPPLGRGCR
jgi:hypothetical protein